jgi:hypothetical protein
MFNSKKGLIVGDIFTSIVNGIRSLISWFFQTAPKPLLFLFFLMFLIFVSNLVIPLISNSIGFHCDTNKVVWKVDGLNLFSNFDILRHKPNTEGVDYLEIPTLCGGSGLVGGNRITYCTNCTVNNINLPPTEQYCTSDGYREEYFNILKKMNCNFFKCGPPVNYFYNFTEDKFQCLDFGCNNRSIEEYNHLIYATEGATPAYDSPIGNYSGSKIVYFKCPENNPTSIRLTFFGLDVFDYKIWLLMIFVIMIVWFYGKVNER